MRPVDAAGVRRAIELSYSTDSRRVLATLIRLLGDFDLAEEALHEAYTAALQQWPQGGVPDNARAWLVSAGRFKAIDRLRQRARFDARQAELVLALDAQPDDPADCAHGLEDDHLRLIFTCCHPALAAEAQVALTLREVCGLTTEDIAQAFLARPATMAQRIVRAKAKIRQAGIPYAVPDAGQLGERLDSVLRVIYLVFNEGYSASRGDSLLRADLSAEAIRLGRQLMALLPAESEVRGLLALMLLHEARGPTRVDDQGELIRLQDQDRRQWDHARIAQADTLVQDCFRRGRVGVYAIQAAIAALHAQADSFAATDWQEIIALYQLLQRIAPSPVVQLNLAVAVSMRDGPAAGLPRIDALIEAGTLSEYHLAHAARADLLQQLGRMDEARVAYQAALERASQGPEQRFLQRQLKKIQSRS